jgi:hypothetical protein
MSRDETPIRDLYRIGLYLSYSSFHLSRSSERELPSQSLGTHQGDSFDGEGAYQTPRLDGQVERHENA